MEWIERLNNAIYYIEKNVTGEIALDQVAKVACCSTYHFQRMFAYMANVTLSEYIRRRKMSLAVADLQGGSQKIIDVALKYGYNSPTAFNRAFQGIHGIAPSLVKSGGVVLKSYPPISFKITIQGVEEMNFRIETKDAFRIVGVAHPLDKDIEKNFATIPQQWQKACADGTLAKLAGMMDGQLMGVLGVSACGDNEEQWQYYIAVASTHQIDGALQEYLVPSRTWAIFPGKGQIPQALQQLVQRIMSEWLPSAGYQYDGGPDIEVYLNDDLQNSNFEIWVPVRQG